jgi:tetratricopeptide (TPR) repeat protein
MRSRSRTALCAILLIALGLRLAYILESQANPLHMAPQMDALYHLEWARGLLAGEAHHPGPFFRAPLYPWFLAGVLLLSRGSLLAVLLLQALLGVGTTYLTHGLARRSFPNAGTLGPLIAALLVAINWVLIYFDGELLLPALSIPLQLLALRLSMDLPATPTTRRHLLTGAAWGIAALARPNCLLFLPILILWQLFRGTHKLTLTLALACGALLPILPVTLYNASQGDSVLISSQAGLNLWIGNNPTSDGSTAIVPGTRPDWWGGHTDALRQAEQAEGRPLRPSEVSRHYARRALTWATSQPLPWLAHLAHKTRLLLGHRELGNNADIDFIARHFSRTMRALPPSFAPLFALGIAGLILGWRRRELAPELPLYLCTYAASIVLFFVCARFRAPLLPLLACGAGHAIAWAYASFRAHRTTPPLALACLAALAGSASLWPVGTAVHDDAPGHWQLGVSALQAGRHADAIQYFEETLRLQPNYGYAWRDLGRTHLELGSFDSAERALRRGLTLHPADPWLGDALADVYFQAKRADDLSALGAELLAAHPEHATAHYHIARAHLLRAEQPAAQEQARLGLAIDPTHFQCLFLSARFHHAQGATTTACAELREALRTAQRLHDRTLRDLARTESARIGCPHTSDN